MTKWALEHTEMMNDDGWCISYCMGLLLAACLSLQAGTFWTRPFGGDSSCSCPAQMDRLCLPGMAGCFHMKRLQYWIISTQTDITIQGWLMKLCGGLIRGWIQSASMKKSLLFCSLQQLMSCWCKPLWHLKIQNT